eukprot:gene8632-579_t
MKIPKAKRRKVDLEDSSRKEEENKINSTLQRVEEEESIPKKKEKPETPLSRSQRKRRKKIERQKISENLKERLEEQNNPKTEKKSKKEKKKKKYALSLDDLDDALDQVEFKKERVENPARRTTKKIMHQTQKEINQLENIFKMDIFQQKPVEVMQQHLTNTVKHKLSEDALKKRRKIKIIKRERAVDPKQTITKTAGKRKRDDDMMEE